MNIEKIFGLEYSSEKKMPVTSFICSSFIAESLSSQEKELIEKNKALNEKYCAFIKTLSPEQIDIINANDSFENNLHILSLTERFNVGFKMGALLMLELLGKGGE